MNRLSNQRVLVANVSGTLVGHHCPTSFSTLQPERTYKNIGLCCPYKWLQVISKKKSKVLTVAYKTLCVMASACLSSLYSLVLLLSWHIAFDHTGLLVPQIHQALCILRAFSYAVSIAWYTLG